MEDTRLTSSINKLKIDLLKYHLSKRSIDDLNTYYSYRLSNTWEIPAPHYHFWISTLDDEIKQEILSSIYRSLGHLLGQSTAFYITEQELLEHPEKLLDKGRNAFVTIDKCSKNPLTTDEVQKWEYVIKVLNNVACPTCFLLLSDEDCQKKFDAPRLYEALFHQTFRHHIEQKKEYSSDDYLLDLNNWFDNNFSIRREETFNSGMRDYLNTVLRKDPINTGTAFLEDLKKRILYECTSKNLDVLDERCIPDYRKESPANKDAKPFNLPKCGDFFDFNEESLPVQDTKNLLVLTLSTLPKDLRKTTVMLSEDQKHDEETYYYQLEPVPYKLMYTFAKNGAHEKLDGILMICSPKTLTPVEINDPRFGEFHDTIQNYFMYTVSSYATQKYYPLSYKAIPTELGEHSTDPDLQAQDTLKFLHDVIGELRSLKRHYPNLNIHLDTHGGFRAAQEILNSLLSLLQMENIIIKQENIHSVEYNAGNAIFTSGAEIFNIMNFVSGIHECINYGQVKSLDMALNKSNNSIEKNVLTHMKTVAEGIQLCDVKKFENGLSDLADSLNALKNSSDSQNASSYLALFQTLIRKSYGEKLLDNEHRHTIDEIKWCIEKDFIQQALTLVESKMPKEIIRNNFLYCPELFDITDSGTIINDVECKHLKADGTPKASWESVENFIFRKFGQTRLERDSTVFLDLKKLDNIHSIPYVYRWSSCIIKNNSNTSWEKRSYNIREQKSARNEINVFIRLHMQLKQIRNETNHAGDDDERFNVDIIRNALNVYVDLYKTILKKLHP